MHNPVMGCACAISLLQESGEGGERCIIDVFTTKRNAGIMQTRAGIIMNFYKGLRNCRILA